MQLSLFDSLQDNFIEAQRRLNEARKHYDDTKKLRDDNCEHRVVDSKNSYFGGNYYSTNKYVYDAHGNLLASYNKNINLTTNVSGSNSVKEDQLISFLQTK